jgi:uncharacterized protein (DUF934 family)
MPLLKQGVVVEDRFRRLVDADALPAEGAVLVTLERWQTQREALLARGQSLGIEVPNSEPVESISRDIPHFALIALVFPKFTDGRAYSQARILRDRLGFVGELRATGQVLTDQLLFLHRCGFDSFELASASPAHSWQNALAAFSNFYQPATDPAVSIPLLRRLGSGLSRTQQSRHAA